MASSLDTISNSDMMSSSSSLTLSSLPITTTISTIAIQSGSTRLVIAVLQSGHYIQLRILEMNPNLATIARNVEKSDEMLKKHAEVLVKLGSKRSPVEELLLQADKISPKNPEVYAAMKESLGYAWRDVNVTLELRRQILQKASDFHKNRSTCLDYFVQLNQNKKEVLVTYRYAVEDGRRLIERLKEAGKDEKSESAYSIGLVEVWLDELQCKRFKWQDELKSVAKLQKQKYVEAEYERIIKEFEDEFRNGSIELDDLRSRLLHLSSSINKSEISDSKISQFQRIIYNLIERITIIMELAEEIKQLINTYATLELPSFRHVYEEKLEVIRTFGLTNIDGLKNTIEKRLEIRKNYERILENPLDYNEGDIQKLICQDPALDVTSALKRIEFEKQKLYTELNEQCKKEEKKLKNIEMGPEFCERIELEMELDNGKQSNVDEEVKKESNFDEFFTKQYQIELWKKVKVEIEQQEYLERELEKTPEASRNSNVAEMDKSLPENSALDIISALNRIKAEKQKLEDEMNEQRKEEERQKKIQFEEELSEQILAKTQLEEELQRKSNYEELLEKHYENELRNKLKAEIEQQEYFENELIRIKEIEAERQIKLVNESKLKIDEQRNALERQQDIRSNNEITLVQPLVENRDRSVNQETSLDEVPESDPIGHEFVLNEQMRAEAEVKMEEERKIDEHNDSAARFFEQHYQVELKKKLDEERCQLQIEAQKLREEHLEELFKTLDFSLPENIETARNDLSDFQKFEVIVEEFDDPPLELIEKLYEKKDKIIRCLQFFELIQKQDRILFIEEIRKLEYDLFQSSKISDEIQEEIAQQLHSSRIEMEIQPAEAVVQNTVQNSEPMGRPLDFACSIDFGSMSDNEVQTIFEKSTMETQTAERDAKLLAHNETQTIRSESVELEPIVLLMQEPAKILSTTQTQTPADESMISFASIVLPQKQTSPLLVEEQLKPQSPAKLFLSNETQTLEPISKEQFFIHEESEERYEAYNNGGLKDEGQKEVKLILDSDTQTHEPSPQLLRNTSSQTKLTMEILNEITPSVNFQIPSNKKLELFSPIQKHGDDTSVFHETEHTGRRVSVKERVAALNTQLIQEQKDDSRRSPTEREGSLPKISDLEYRTESAGSPIPEKIVTTTKRIFERYEEEVCTRRTESPELYPLTTSSMQDSVDYKPKKVKDFKKLFEGVPEKKPRNVPIQVEFPVTMKVGKVRQLFEGFDSDGLSCLSPPPLPAYQISSIRQSSKYDASNRNYQSNYSESVSCFGVDPPHRRHSSTSPYVTFQDSRPESALSDCYIANTMRPTKFIPAKFTESDYESDYESFKIEPIWIPPSSRSRPTSAYEFRSFSPAATERQVEGFRPNSTAFEIKKKPIPPPKPSTFLPKPIALKQKPEISQKPVHLLHQQPDKITTDQMTFNVSEPVSDSVERHKQLVSTLTKTEETKFYLRPIESPVHDDDELQVRKSVSPTYYVGLTSPPIFRPNLKNDCAGEIDEETKIYNRQSLSEERSWQSYDSGRPNSFEFSHYLEQSESSLDSRSGRPRSAGFHKRMTSEGTGRPKSMEIVHSIGRDPDDVPKATQEKFHDIIMK